MHRWLLLSLLLLFLALSLYQLDLPGLHYDEAFEAVPTMQLLRRQPTQPFRNSAITLFGRQFPLTTQDYIGALNTYGLLPFVALGGPTTISLRLYSLAIALATLWLAYGFTVYFSHSQPAGLVTVAWLAVNPTFIFWSRQGIFVTAITTLIGLAAAWSWLAWWRTGRYRFAWLGAFLFGLGLYAKLLFIWLVGAMVVIFGLTALAKRLSSGQLWRQTGLSISRLAGLLLAGALGCWPLILYNLQTGGTFKSIAENADVSYYGVNNADILTNLGQRIEQFGILLSGGHLWYLGDVYANILAVAIFVILFLAGLGLTWPVGKRAKPAEAKILLPYLLIGLVLLQSVMTVSALWITHFALLMVWPAIALAVTWAHLAGRFQQRRLLKAGLYLLLGLLLVGELRATLSYHQALARSGGLGSHSDAVYDLATWLQDNQTAPAIAMDWGLAAPVIYLSGGAVNVVEVFGYGWQTNDRFNQFIEPHLTPQAAIFLWRAPDEIIFDRSEAFKAIYRPQQLEETILAAFYERSGRPIIGATQLVPVGTAENKPVEP